MRLFSQRLSDSELMERREEVTETCGQRRPGSTVAGKRRTSGTMPNFQTDNRKKCKRDGIKRTRARFPPCQLSSKHLRKELPSVTSPESQWHLKVDKKSFTDVLEMLVQTNSPRAVDKGEVVALGPDRWRCSLFPKPGRRRKGISPFLLFGCRWPEGISE